MRQAQVSRAAATAARPRRASRLARARRTSGSKSATSRFDFAEQVALDGGVEPAAGVGGDDLHRPAVVRVRPALDIPLLHQRLDHPAGGALVEVEVGGEVVEGERVRARARLRGRSTGSPTRRSSRSGRGRGTAPPASGPTAPGAARGRRPRAADRPRRRGRKRGPWWMGGGHGRLEQLPLPTIFPPEALVKPLQLGPAVFAQSENKSGPGRGSTLTPAASAAAGSACRWRRRRRWRPPGRSAACRARRRRPASRRLGTMCTSTTGISSRRSTL